MKTRNYQHLTIVAALLLFLAPLGVAVLVASAGSTATYDASAASPSTASPSTASPSTASPSTAGPSTAGPSTASPRTDVPSRRTDSPGLLNDAGRDVVSSPLPSLAPSLPSPLRSPLAAMTETLPEKPLEAETQSPTFPVEEVAKTPAQPADSVIPGVTPLGAPAVTEQDLQPPQPVIPDESFYDATGHPALTGQPQPRPEPADQTVKPGDAVRPAQGSAAGSGGVSPADPPGAAGHGATSDGSDRRSRQRKRQSPEAGRRDGRDRRDHGRAGSAAGTSAAETVSPAATPDNLEEVIVQTPLESGRVRKIEDVVAMTSAAGWPIALVRSDIPDDEWWVQQMVTIQGTTFAARVNFGNEHSLPGSAYRMVFVFLDSPDEVRRFRIAKRFRELPEGIRRSREFRYVRN